MTEATTLLAIPGHNLFAVHLADGTLSDPWWIGGFALAGVLLAWSAWRIREEEISTIALMAATFFVASLPHVPIGPARVHLLLTGLIGVVLGRRCGLALAAALGLQAALLQHGGISTLGVNLCVMTLPALLTWGLFRLLHRAEWVRSPGYRASLVAVAVALWCLCAVFSVVLVATNRLRGLETIETDAALRATLHPLTLGLVALAALLCAAVERRLNHAPEFPLGMLLGLIAVLGTTALEALALVWGGAEDFRAVVLLTVVAHLPVAVVEGIVLGFTTGFLARVKPELLGLDRMEPSGVAASDSVVPTVSQPRTSARRHSPAPLLALLTLLAATAPARAHNLLADYRVLPERTVRIESWYDLTGDAAQGASVKVFHSDGKLLTEGKIDADGHFTFQFAEPENLRVIVNAGAGHRAVVKITAERLGAPPRERPAELGPRDDPSPAEPVAERSPRGLTAERVQKITLGLLLFSAVVIGVTMRRRYSSRTTI